MNKKRLLIPKFDLVEDRSGGMGAYRQREFRVTVVPNAQAEVMAINTMFPHHYEDYIYNRRAPQPCASYDDIFMGIAQSSFRRLAGEVEKQLRDDFMAAIERGRQVTRFEVP